MPCSELAFPDWHSTDVASAPARSRGLDWDCLPLAIFCRESSLRAFPAMPCSFGVRQWATLVVTWESWWGPILDISSVGDDQSAKEKKDIRQQVTSDAARSYELKIGDLESLVADPARIDIDDAAYLGHMANDRAMLVTADPASRQAYSAATLAGHNAAFFDMAGCHFVATATKRIAKDEEIFVSHGDGYWMSRVL